MGEFKNNPPSADILMNSMRSMGYSFNSAVADIIDNSVSADAKNITINFPTEASKCFLTILDDGHGMTDKELFLAMKYGSFNSTNIRSENDMGRFGLGLKSASLSQCRKLTVASKKNSKISACSWDLDLIIEQKDWILDILNQNEINNLVNINLFENIHEGTLVIWENFDIFVNTHGCEFTSLNEQMEPLNTYLSLIFHRFINDNKLKIKINNYTLEGLDPFLEKHNKTTAKPERVITLENNYGDTNKILVKPFILPFQKYINKKDRKKLGVRSKQGFYIYRNKRLIIWGTWFNMKPRHEITKNARIRVDIPNSLDDIWKIDIKKQNAELPKKIKNRLIKIVENTFQIATRVQKFRGRVNNSDNLDYVWNRIEDRNGIRYEINRNSKIFELIYEENAINYNNLSQILNEIERNLPYQQIYIDKSENLKINETFEDKEKEEIYNLAENILSYKELKGEELKLYIQDLFKSEPFNKFNELQDVLKEKYKDA